VRRLVAEGIAPNCGDDLSPTVLSEPILYDRIAVVRALLEAGANPNLRWRSHGDRLPVQDVIEDCGWASRRESPPPLLRSYGAASFACRRLALFTEPKLAVGERRLVAQICPRWNHMQPWFELAEAFRSAA
jgi:ankyrin repeat protein